MSIRPRIAVLVFPGSNDDRDAAWALGALGADAQLVWHAEEALPRDTAAVVLPGGFSYGDYLRCGAIARFAPVLDAVRELAAAGGPVLGICNGFQILCEAGLLPGVLRRNRDLEFVCRDVRLRVERTDTVFTARCEPGQELTIPVKHGEGIVVRGRRAVRRAGGGGPAGAALRGGLQRLGGRRRGCVQRGAATCSA